MSVRLDDFVLFYVSFLIFVKLVNMFVSFGGSSNGVTIAKCWQEQKGNQLT